MRNPKVGTFKHEQQESAARKTNDVPALLSPDIQWPHVPVAGNDAFRACLAKEQSVIHKHAALSAVPATQPSKIYQRSN